MYLRIKEHYTNSDGKHRNTSAVEGLEEITGSKVPVLHIVGGGCKNTMLTVYCRCFKPPYNSRTGRSYRYCNVCLSLLL